MKAVAIERLQPDLQRERAASQIERGVAWAAGNTGKTDASSALAAKERPKEERSCRD